MIIPFNKEETTKMDALLRQHLTWDSGPPPCVQDVGDVEFFLGYAYDDKEDDIVGVNSYDGGQQSPNHPSVTQFGAVLCETARAIIYKYNLVTGEIHAEWFCYSADELLVAIQESGLGGI